MKKKSISKTFYILIFLAAVYLVLYILNEFRNSYFAVGACGIIFLVAGYLLVTALEREKEDQKQEQFETFYQLNKQMAEVIKVQKAIYTAIKKENQVLSEKMDATEKDGVGQQRELLEKIAVVQERSIQENKRLAEIQVNALKAVAKYNKENARQLALNANENADRIVESIQESISDLKQQIKNSGIHAVPFQAEDEEGDSDPTGDSSSDGMSDIWKIGNSSRETGEGSPNAVEENRSENQGNGQSDLENDNQETEENGSADLEESTSESTEQTKEEPPAPPKPRPDPPVIDDPNRKMTPEEIAQLIAHMTQG